MNSLKPCPFCGCEAEIISAKNIHGGYLFGIMCKYCCSRGDVHHTEEQAIDAWNSRAERTCKQSRLFNLVWSECSSKSYEWHGNELPSYCPNCGAKVVKQ